MDEPVKAGKKPANAVKENINEILKPSTGDIAHTIARAGISTLPVVGGAAVELFNAMIIPPLNKRRDEWIKSIAIDLMEIEKKVDGFSIENLSKNEVFITTVAHATYTAIRNHHEEKLKALRNAVINSALSNSPDEDLQLMFINFIDSLTPWHLRILSLFDDPIKYTTERKIKCPAWAAAGLRSLILHVFPELKNRDNFLLQIIRDLFSRGLIVSDSIGTLLSAGGVYERQTTELGKQFIKFITSN